MHKLGKIKIQQFLTKTKGEVTGHQLSDGKDRIYNATYEWEAKENGSLYIKRKGTREAVRLPQEIELDKALIAFFGLYSGDGAKGSEDSSNPGVLKTSISFSQKEPNLVKFAVGQFKRIFPQAYFVFSLGEDSAYFMEGEGKELLKAYYGGNIPSLKKLSEVRSELNAADEQYLSETRHIQQSAEDDLSFFYQHKKAMEEILIKQKANDISGAGINLSSNDRITASLRRPYKKGARLPGGSSRSDETHVGNVSGIGELFLKIMHEIEETLLNDTLASTQGLIQWYGKPSEIGEEIEVKSFFENNPYGSLSNQRPISITDNGSVYLEGLWRASKVTQISRSVTISPLFCYTSGLYLAEGTSPKEKMFQMYKRSVTGLGLGFTSSENISLELILRTLQSIFPKEVCVDMWKVKVGSQYFPELVVIGLKNAVPMLRGGKSGDGKMRTMEISLAIKSWALDLTPCMKDYEYKFSHVEPTGAGVPRVDFSASSSLCRWYFPLMMYAVFGDQVHDPQSEFLYD